MDRRRQVEEQIRAAQERGAFDNLPGAGKPLRITDAGDPDWFVKSLIRREKIDPSTLVHPTIALRREAEGFPASLADLRTEQQVRAVLEDFNERVKAEWRRPQVGPSLPVIARPVKIEPLVARWHELREQARAETVAAGSREGSAVEAVPRRPRRRWWLLGRRVGPTSTD
jgi:hypothetical protein